ncbi:MAG TPA: alpha/beta hydrolase [Vicinamibacterales bacterium]|nr:alpha/beta hydrolase [Vicinamibacterales bacterium]
MKRVLIQAMVIIGVIAAGAAGATAQPLQLAGATCVRPPVLHCPDKGCAADVVTSGGPVTEPKTGRTFFLDYPCNLKRGEQVAFILSLHGGGSYGNWQRHYFPILDYTDKYRLVIATPFSPRRVWTAEDDGYLQNIVSSVIEQVGRENIKAFWLAGHSQGGLTSTRIICSEFFSTKVDGFLSLSGGRVGGQAGRAANFGIPAAAGAAAAGRATPPAGLPAGALTIPPPPTCDFSHIFETGEHEISELPKISERAQKYGCSADMKRREITDVRAGYVYDGTRQSPGTKAWGLLPRPGKTEILAYRNCRDGRIVADVVRRDKGHTEGLEPKVTEELVKMMLSARGGKIQHGG